MPPPVSVPPSIEPVGSTLSESSAFRPRIVKNGVGSVQLLKPPPMKAQKTPIWRDFVFDGRRPLSWPVPCVVAPLKNAESPTVPAVGAVLRPFAPASGAPCRFWARRSMLVQSHVRLIEIADLAPVVGICSCMPTPVFCASTPVGELIFHDTDAPLVRVGKVLARWIWPLVS